MNAENTSASQAETQPDPADASPGPAPCLAPFNPQPSTINPQPSFPRSPGETPRAYSAFLAFFQLGHGRSLQAVADHLGEKHDTVKAWSSKYHDIVTCCRTSKVLADGRHWRPRVYSTTNPGGVGHAWYRSRYVVPFQQRSETSTRFIPATINDNSFTNAEYRDILDSLTGWQKRAWRDGDWDIAAGQFFTTFRRDVHVIDDFDDHRAVEWTAALDYGFSHYTVALLGCTDSDGNLFVVDEHAARQWVPDLHAKAIKAMLQRHRVSLASSWKYSIALRRFVAGADLFARQSTGATIAGQYSELGIPLRQANTDRINGWAEIIKRLGDPDAAIAPRLFIHRRCARLVDCLPSLQHDPNRPEDVLKVDPDDDGIGGDDAADALRYLVASKPREVFVRKLRGL